MNNRGFRVVEDSATERIIVLRGGAWVDYQEEARADSSGGSYPYDRGDAVGFRVIEEIANEQ